MRIARLLLIAATLLYSLAANSPLNQIPMQRALVKGMMGALAR